MRAGGYRPHAWWQLLLASWQQAQATAANRPAVVMTWRHLTIYGVAATLGMGAYTAYRHGTRTLLASQGWLLLATVIIAGDTYVHLGLHRSVTHHPYDRLGPAMPLTIARYWVGGWMLSRLFSHPLTTDEQAAALAVMLATDIADGMVARRTALTSALGRYLDGTADMLAWTALTITQVRRRQLPASFLVIFALRWGVPVTLGLGQSFVTTHPAPLAPSALGRLAGTAHVFLSMSSIVAAWQRNRTAAPLWSRLHRGGIVATSVLLGVTTLHHSFRLIRRFRIH